MKSKKIEQMPTDHLIRRSTFITVVCDVILILALVVCLLTFISYNNHTNHNRNLANILDIAVAESGIMHTVMHTLGNDVKNAYYYSDGKSIEEIMDYLSMISESEENEYQLIARDKSLSTDLYHVYRGYSTRKNNSGYQSVIYKGTSLSDSIYNSNAPLGEICFSNNFVNCIDGLRYFAVYCSITAVRDGEECVYYLIKPQKEKIILDQLQLYSTYSNLSLAICYADGQYLANTDNYDAGNFYNYLYKYNNISLKEKARIKSIIKNDEDGNGILEYKDHLRRNSVYAYALCEDTDDWSVIVKVPLSDFETTELISFYPTIIIVFLIILLVFNVWRLFGLVSQLQMSVKREAIANSAKSSFLSRMSHEIRTPLNAVIGYNTIAQSKLETPGKFDDEQIKDMVLDCLNKSDMASKHLLSIINDVLDISAIESGRVKVTHDRFDLKSMIQSVSTVFYSQASSKGVNFKVINATLSEEWFIGDHMRLSQVITNLLSNAIKFTPKDGNVTLKICQLDNLKSKAHIRFIVEDNGIGMSKDYLKRIWTPFDQEDSSISRRFGGTGLGLSITKSLVEIMDGTISVTSKQGEGTTFTVEVYLERTEQPTPIKKYNFESIKALVVDDDSDICSYIRLLFEQCDTKCDTVNSGLEALEKTETAISNGQPYTLFIIDWLMPEMDGMETIRRLQTMIDKRTPIIVLTAYDYSAVISEAASIGINRFISKPLFKSSLYDLLANICGVCEPDTTMSTDIEHNFNGARVLLVEDDELNMEIAKCLLDMIGLVVDYAWNGEEAVEIFENSEFGKYSAILMDVHMPKMNGYEATKTIRESKHPQAKNVPILAMTADVFAEDVVQATESGMNGHIGKPIEMQTLITVLEQYIH